MIGRWGWPTADLGVFAGMLAATVTSIIESIGDYYATADMCSIPLPPKHALNRGIAAEGFGGVLAGLLSAAHATTSYSSTVGFIGITGVSGLSIVGFGMLISIGMSNLKHIDASSPRNMIAIGVSIMMGMTLPGWLKANPGLIDTGYSEVDQLLTVILTTEMFVGGVLACLLDNILPGTMEERGMGVFNSLPSHKSDVDRDYAELRAKTYDFPCGNEALKRIKCCTYMPFLPSYKERKATCRSSVSDTERMYANNYQKDSNSVTEL
ncbi:hypothetical protein LSH36_521g01021 [Paralvinella palmiformis]|uniref:Uncharacterized protein n=1 Tax=Paralvinella palmiformis TaxID=53620 RepID=A0AAD9MW74_9ANNE|nr:hypothetical protein LSH36_521g01021 [Paralvinella palmiformis]